MPLKPEAVLVLKLDWSEGLEVLKKLELAMYWDRLLNWVARNVKRYMQ